MEKARLERVSSSERKGKRKRIILEGVGHVAWKSGEGGRGRGGERVCEGGKRRKEVVKATERGDIGDILTRSAN